MEKIYYCKQCDSYFFEDSIRVEKFVENGRVNPYETVEMCPQCREWPQEVLKYDVILNIRQKTHMIRKALSKDPIKDLLKIEDYCSLLEELED